MQTLTAAEKMALALAACNSCDVETAHDGCQAGYCSSCCPVH